MLSQMRQNTKTVLWIVIVAFVGLIVVAWGMNYTRTGGREAGVIGKIDGVRVTVTEYSDELRNQRAAYYEEKGRRSSAQAESELDQKAWDTVVQNHMLSEALRRENLFVTDDEVLLELRTNPPAFVRSQPVFQTDSVFDHDKYLSALQQEPQAFVGLESYIRETLPRQKLVDYVISGVRVTSEEARMMLAMLEDKAAVSYVKVNPLLDVKQITVQPTDSDVSSYYASHTDEFKVFERCKLKYVQFLKKPSAEDEGFAMDRLQEALDLVNEGENFEEIAAEYSDDETTAPRGGDLGWRKRGQLSGVLDSVAFALEPGSVSGIIRTPNALHVLKLEEKRVTDGVEEARIRHILAKLEASSTTIEELTAQAVDFKDLATRKGLTAAAAEKGLTTLDSPELAREQIASFLRASAEEAEPIAKSVKGDVTGPVDGAQAIYVTETSDVVAEHVPPVEDIKDRVKQAYLFSLRKEKARGIAQAVVEGVARGQSLEDAAGAWNLSVAKTDLFSRTTQVPGIGKDNAVTAVAFALAQGETSGLVENGNDFFVVRLDQRQAADLAALGQNLGQIKYSLLTTKQQAYLSDWYTNLLSKAEIEDYRSVRGGGQRFDQQFYGGY